VIGDDAGSATVLGVAVVAVLTAVTVAVVALGSALLARHRAVSAADLAALAAASVLLTGTGEPCPTAERLVRAQGVEGLRVDGCEVDGERVTVRVSVPVRLGRFGVHTATGVALAGPVS